MSSSGSLPSNAFTIAGLPFPAAEMIVPYKRSGVRAVISFMAIVVRFSCMASSKAVIFIPGLAVVVNKVKIGMFFGAWHLRWSY